GGGGGGGGGLGGGGWGGGIADDALSGVLGGRAEDRRGGDGLGRVGQAGQDGDDAEGEGDSHRDLLPLWGPVSVATCPGAPLAHPLRRDHPREGSDLADLHVAAHVLRAAADHGRAGEGDVVVELVDQQDAAVPRGERRLAAVLEARLDRGGGVHVGRQVYPDRP